VLQTYQFCKKKWGDKKENASWGIVLIIKWVVRSDNVLCGPTSNHD